MPQQICRLLPQADVVMSLTSALVDCLRHSLVGQGIYLASGRRLYIPEYERTCIAPTKISAQSSAASGDKPSETTKEAAVEIVPGEVVVGWDGPDDPANPKNWSGWKKSVQVLCTFGLTLSAYLGTAIFTPSANQMIEKFNCTVTQFELGITLFVWGYGIGPLLFAPMSESPHFGGRLYLYIIGQLVFCAVQLATALIDDVASFAVLRFISGVFAAAPLTNGAATIADMFHFPVVVFVLAGWSLSFVTGSYLGPLIGAAFTHGSTWRWSFWFLLMFSGGVLLVISLVMVETSAQELLIRKARYLRKTTGKPFVSPGELKARGATLRRTLKELLWGPIDLCLHEPVLNLINLHLTLVYALLYLFFECFPLIFVDIYGFTNVELGAAFLSLMVGFAVSATGYSIYLRQRLFAENVVPEKVFIPPCLAAAITMPAGIFIVGWSSTYHAHWIGSMIGCALYGGATWVMFQTYTSYIGQLYPFRFASALASSTLVRSVIGGSFPLFGRFLYLNTGSEEFPVGWGCSILAFCGIAMILLPVYLYIKGEGLRARAMAKYGNRDV